jgi:hypothetical protein
MIVNRPERATIDYFDACWRPLIVRDDRPSSPVVPSAPRNMADMVGLAEALAEDFESCCVDLYNIDGKAYFGEITHYCAAGMAGFSQDFDAALGEIWRNGGPIPERFYRADAPPMAGRGPSPDTVSAPPRNL